jgi:hypothetical protein
LTRRHNAIITADIPTVKGATVVARTGVEERQNNVFKQHHEEHRCLLKTD